MSKLFDAAARRSAAESPRIEMARSDGGDGPIFDLSAPDLAVPPDLATATIAPDLTAPAADLAQPIDLGPFPPGAFYQVSVKATGQLLSVHNSATADGSVVEEQPAHATADQRWSLTATATAGTYHVLIERGECCKEDASERSSLMRALGRS